MGSDLTKISEDQYFTNKLKLKNFGIGKKYGDLFVFRDELPISLNEKTPLQKELRKPIRYWYHKPIVVIDLDNNTIIFEGEEKVYKYDPKELKKLETVLY